MVNWILIFSEFPFRKRQKPISKDNYYANQENLLANWKKQILLADMKRFWYIQKLLVLSG